MIDRKTIVNRFIRYTSFDTTSDESNNMHCPSTPNQMVFAKALAEELKQVGLEDIDVDECANVTATLPANGAEGTVIGFLAHMDTVADASGKDVKPFVLKNYDGKDIVLNKEKNIVFSTKAFPSVLKYKGQDIIFTDGTTLLGADDKAGIAGIMTAMEYLLAHPEIKHGKVRVAFTPDEEIGTGIGHFNVEKFGADYAYTVDGGEAGAYEYECFNADNPIVTIHGISVHTGTSKNKMVNALTIASEWQQMLPAGEKPEYTEGHEGFFHVYKMGGNVEKCTLYMLVRDHDAVKFAKRKEYLQHMVDFFNAKYGAGTVEIQFRSVYYNMLEKLKDHMDLIELAKEAMESLGLTPFSIPVRGGTDGAQLSYRGLPCPNVFTGGVNSHGRFEYLPVESLIKCSETVVEIAKRAYTLKK